MSTEARLVRRSQSEGGRAKVDDLELRDFTDLDGKMQPFLSLHRF
ncbi:MAG: hypothetical protein ABIE14_01315 [Patescibacteria group bacterium]